MPLEIRFDEAIRRDAGLKRDLQSALEARTTVESKLSAARGELEAVSAALRSAEEERLEVEQQLVQDADERGWTREVERHTAVARRLQGLLTDLGETTDPDDDPQRGPRPCTSTD